MKIYNKVESSKKIEELKLNKFSEAILKQGEENKVLEFIEKNPAKYYALRDKSKMRGIFKLKVTKEEIFKEIVGYELFSINVSSANYVDNQLLVGEVEFLSNNEVYLILSKNPVYSVRDAISNPDYNLKTNIFDRKLNEIPFFDNIYKYVIENNLIDVIVELAIFDINLGINKEKIIVYELRTSY